MTVAIAWLNIIVWKSKWSEFILNIKGHFVPLSSGQKAFWLLTWDKWCLDVEIKRGWKITLLAKYPTFLLYLTSIFFASNVVQECIWMRKKCAWKIYVFFCRPRYFAFGKKRYKDLQMFSPAGHMSLFLYVQCFCLHILSPCRKTSKLKCKS